ncbi:MAG: tyrosine-protein phosphatase [Oscillospiraceae bacterium]|nr:tyrosine-protein phosphatase [Oscillospiraceae bacterium]
MLSEKRKEEIDRLYEEIKEEKNTKETESSENIHEGSSEHSSEHHHEHHHEHEHGHSHHHHHHHHKHSKKRRKTNGSFGDFFKKHRSAFKGAAVAVLILGVINVMIWAVENNLANEEPVDKQPQKIEQPVKEEVSYDEELIYIGVPVMEDEVFLVNNVTTNYMAADYNVPVSALVKHDSEARYDVGLPAVLKFDLSKISGKKQVIYSTLEISEDESFINSRLFELDENGSASVYHLKTGTEYHYRLRLYFSGNEKLDFCGSFKTAETPRILSIDGAYNVRDIGGWKTENGFKIRQGVLYRGTEIDGAVEAAYKLSKKGTEDMISVLGIRTDMDLRAETDSVPGTYILGANVEHIYYNASMYSSILTEVGETAVKAVFSDLAKPEKYPVYLHCTYGLDRTGTICAILEALLGMSEKRHCKRI